MPSAASCRITTRMPEKLESTAKETVALQDFSLWGTANTFHTNVQSFTIGDKINDLSWFRRAHWNHTTTQPLTFISGGVGHGPELAREFIWISGRGFRHDEIRRARDGARLAGNLLSDYVNAKVKLATNFTPTIRATYMEWALYTNDQAIRNARQLFLVRRATNLRIQ